MKKILFATIVVCLSSVAIFAQKGIDKQTEKIKDDANKQTSRESDAGRSISWGKGKTKTRLPLTNPYKMNGRRDELIESIKDVLAQNKILIDDASSRYADGVIVTQPVIFAKGPVTASSELHRYGNVQYEDTAWSRGQYSLTIEIQPIDGIQNNVSVTAKVEGRAANGLMVEWRTVQSSGLAEDQFLAKLVEAVTGVSPDPVQDTPDQ